MKSLLTILILLICSLSGTFLQFGANAQNQQFDAGINIIPDKVAQTDNGIRITLCIIGIPHTSQRIDGIDLVSGTQTVKATDIDGVDFERYFQFEDKGVLVIEVDFPFKDTLSKTAHLVIHTVKGDITAPAHQ